MVYSMKSLGIAGDFLTNLNAEQTERCTPKTTATALAG